MELAISEETYKTLFFALNIAVNNCAPGNKEKIRDLQDELLFAKDEWRKKTRSNSQSNN